MNTSLASDMTFEVIVGNKKLVSSGLVHLDEPRFEISIHGLVIEIVFISERDSAPKYVGNVVDGRLRMELINHNNSLGEGVFTPIEIGKINDKSLYMTYYVFVPSASENKRSFEFAFYLGDA
ncbi:MAG: hypothetical protein V4536_01955 [Pseudomonadota bacterium]